MLGDAVYRELGDMMIRGWMSKASAALLMSASALALSTASAQAADLGGNCCADLEERIAELEATTARKGNRKVSLEVSGQVNEALMYFDDGTESNAYIVTNDNSRSRFRFKGKAKINSDLEAGYLLEIGVRGANSKRVNQDDDNAVADSGFDLRHSTWFLKSKTFGQVNVGLTGTASEEITEANLSQTGAFAKYSDVEDSGLGMRLRRNGSPISALSWRRLLKDTGDQAGEGDRENIVRYETPEFKGFTAVAAWGEDDFWDVGLKYAGEIGDFKLIGRVAYSETTEDPVTAAGNTIDTQCLSNSPAGTDTESDAQCNSLGGSISVMHSPTGLYANFAAGQFQDDLIENSTGVNGFAGTGADDTSTFYAVQAGIERKWNELGKTTVYGEYYNNDGGANGRRAVAANDSVNPFGATASRIFGSEVEVFGLGVAQGIDAASMTLYLSYRHIEGDLTVKQNAAGAAGAVSTIDLDDLDIVMTGGIIKF
jgi:predicted porin